MYMVYTQFYLITGEIQRRKAKKICLKMVITLSSSWLKYCPIHMQNQLRASFFSLLQPQNWCVPFVPETQKSYINVKKV